MMGLNLHVRRAAIKRMAGNSSLLALLPATSVFGQTIPPTPTLPFVKTGVPQVLPIRASRLLGGNVTLPIDAFAGPRVVVGQTVETAEDYAARIGEAIEQALQNQGENVTVNGQPLRIRYRLTDIRLFPDGAEIDVFHWSGLLNARAVAE